ncbi:uracil-DNA glycosylase [Marinicella meishanensis]|uniref:uracil-DNA glycosylase n=1 Tax=Marinicella meishanensis TaxID=2873263 RepID=UPI001CC003EA|nr:uracil-DNA glycosylase [Marinicella sp. NBU2979]
MPVQLDDSWLAHLGAEFEQPYMQQLKAFLQQEKHHKKIIYPPGQLMFNALNTTPLDQVKVVILGQDPYHGPGQAHGLSFSVPPGIKPPPSLLNIFKEIEADLGIRNAIGDLTAWARQGVLLLNSVLSVEQARAGSHQGRGWETFTDRIIEVINQHAQHVVFMLWGSYAQKKGQHIDGRQHLVLRAPHPSPLSAHRGFLGCRHFSQCNAYLQQNEKSVINWQLVTPT